MEPSIFRDNRSHFSESELAGYEGQWVAFSSDGRRTVASSPDLIALDQLVIEVGEDPEHVTLERIESGDVFMGGAELI